MANKKLSTSEIAITQASIDALDMWNENYQSAWSFGSNWSNVGTQFETFVNKYLFPKINETAVIDIALGNRFQWLAKEKDFIAQYNEEYVIKDAVPVAMNLSKDETLMLRRNYPSMITKLYREGILKKMKFTLNDNDSRLNWLTLADGVSYALAVYKKRISDINVSEEMEIKGMIVDYFNQYVTGAGQVRTATSDQQFHDEVFEALLNIQNNSSRYNESATASNGAIGRYTTVTDLRDVAILTTDKMKRYLLTTQLANTFQVAGIDLTEKIISFDDLGGVYKATADFQITTQATIDYLKTFGDYQVAINDYVRTGDVFTFDVSALTEFAGNVEEVKPDSDRWGAIFDINAIRYEQYTRNMIRHFTNEEFGETTTWLHYYSRKNISPFFNKILVKGA